MNDSALQALERAKTAFSVERHAAQVQGVVRSHPRTVVTRAARLALPRQSMNDSSSGPIS